MADTNNQKTEDVEETSGDSGLPTEDQTPAQEAPSEDSGHLENQDEEAPAHEISGDSGVEGTSAETPAEQVEQTESEVASDADAGEEETSPEKVEANEVSGDTKAESSSAEEQPEELEQKPEEKTQEDSGQAPEETAGQEPSEEKDTQQARDQSITAGKKDSNIPDDAKWFIVHTYAGHENKVARNLKQRVESMGFEDRIFDIIVPTRETIKVSQGRKETVQEKIFPGYVIIRMVLDDESWLLVRTTQGVTAFIGAGNKPTPISEQEVEAIQKFMQMDEPLYKAAFSVGEAVKIVDGPFADFLGTIDDIDEARGKIKVLVSIFGRETPVELDFLQAQKL